MRIRTALRYAAAIAGFTSTAAAAQQSDPATFTVGTATAQRGALATGVIAVPAGSDSALSIPVAVIHGARPGPVVAFVAGSHGTEYTSIIALQQLISRVDPQRLSGIVIVVPLINIPSFEAMTPHLNPVDRKGMNGGYPGDSTGTQTPRALALITKQVVIPSDIVVDLHGGDLDEDLRPYSYWFRVGHAGQDSAGLKLVKAFGLDHVIVTDINPDAPNAGRTLSGQSLTRGKTVLVAEAGRSGIVAPADLTALIDGSLNVLASLRMLDRPVPALGRIVWLDGTGARVGADSAGVFFAAVPRDSRVTKGELIGHTTDFLGRKTGDVRSPIDGLVAFIRGVPSVWRGATLADVLPVLPAAPQPWKAPQP